MAQETFASWNSASSSNSTIEGDATDGNVNIAEACAPGNVNNAIRAIMAAANLAFGDLPSGTSRPSYLASGKFWKNTTTATAPIITFYDGTDDIAVFTVNTTANTVSFNGSTTGFDITGLTAETAPAVADVLAIYDDSAAANRKMTLPNFFKIINGLTAETAPAVDDELALYDLSATATDKITLANLFKVINALTAETAPATDDELAIYDLSATTTDKITLANMLKVINSLTEDTTPDTSNDVLMTYDNSASAVKKVKLTNLGVGGITRGTPSTTTGGSAIDFTIAAGVDKVLLMLAGVSQSGTDELLVQLGDSGGIETTGYTSSCARITNLASSTSGFLITNIDAAAAAKSGGILLTRLDGNQWTQWGVLSDATPFVYTSAGDKTLSAELTTVRLTVTGSDTFDAMAANVFTET